MRKLTILPLLLLMACSTAPLSEAERSVRILKKSDPEKGCTELGKVHAPGLASFTDEGRESDLKRAAYKIGGDTVTLDKVDANMTNYGTAYKCPK